MSVWLRIDPFNESQSSAPKLYATYLEVLETTRVVLVLVFVLQLV